MFVHETVSSTSLLPLLAIMIPSVAALVIGLIGGRNEKIRNFFALLSALATFGVALATALTVFGGGELK